MATTPSDIDVTQLVLPVLGQEKPKFGKGQCTDCSGLCCRYITVEIEPPQNWTDLDNLRWYIIHDKVSILVEEKNWMVKFDTPCQHLGADHRCTIYNSRPQACRDYTTDDCDYMTWKGGYPAAYREFTDFKRLKQFVEDYWWPKNGCDDD